MANFRTKARAIDLLGKNQIADLPTAITELWKNGYDAYGDYLDAKLYAAGHKGIQNDIFTLSDDGHGMTNEDILNKWIVIGTDSKRNVTRVIPEEDRFGKENRIPLGEKGIGRLSVTYLGNHMLMITKKKNCNAQMLFMNWRVLENYEMFLDDVEIPVSEIGDLSLLGEKYGVLLQEYHKNFNNESWTNFQELKAHIKEDLERYSSLPDIIQEDIRQHFDKFGHGTFFVVLDPIKELVDLQTEQSKDIKENRDEKLDYRSYVKSTLSGLFNPFDKKLLQKREQVLGDIYASPSFTIYNSDGSEYDFLGREFYTEDDFNNCEHWIDGWFDETGHFTGKIKVFGDIKEYSYTQRVKPRAYIGKLVVRVAFWEGLKSNSSMPEEKWLNYDKKGNLYSGLYVYRDGFRVLPYGKADYDFLEFEKDRSKSAGTYYFSYRKMFGFIGITKDGNPELIDKAGREGFVSNESYREFRRLLKGFFKKVAADNYATKSEARRDHIKEKQKEASREKLVEEERKRNHQMVMDILDQAEQSEALLKNIKEKFWNIKGNVEKKIDSSSAVHDKELLVAIEQIDILISEINSLRIIVPGDVSLYGYDEIEDYIDEVNSKCSSAEKLASDLLIKITSDAKVQTLAERYVTKCSDAIKLISEMGTKVLNRIDLATRTIDKKSQNTFDLRFSDLTSLNFEVDKLHNMSSEEIQSYMNKIDTVVKDCRSFINTDLITMAEHLENLSSNSNWCETLTAYKYATSELTHKLDIFYELAQVGMAIDVVDHQFNILYEQIGKNIKKLEMMSNDSNVSDTVSNLKMEFQHMEENQKMLMPLYRRTRKRRSAFNGGDIKKIIIQFYGEIFEKNNVRFETTNAFLNYQFYSYESVIMPVFLNVINNALYWVEYATGDKIIIIDVKKDEILILDSGSKMTHTELTRCFELFYTKKSADSGRGIGLFLAKRSLHSVDMEIYATNDETYNYLNGACFVIKKN